jgi:hypothetical protein
MKVSRVLKRITKIEALMSKVTERSSTLAPHVRALLGDAKAAVIRAKEAVGLHASTGTGKNAPVKNSKPRSNGTPEPSKVKRNLSAAGRKAIVDATKRRWALKRAKAPKAAVKQAGPTRKKGTIKKTAVKAPAKATKRSAPGYRV